MIIDITIEIWTILENYFKLSIKATEAAQRIQAVEENWDLQSGAQTQKAEF